MERSCWCGDQSGSVAVLSAVALTMLMSVADEVRALTLPDYTLFPNWNDALAAAKATAQGNLAAGALPHDFNAANSLQKIQTSFWDLSWTRDTTPANLKGHLNPAGYYTSDNSDKDMPDLIRRILQPKINLPRDGRIRQ